MGTAMPSAFVIMPFGQKKGPDGSTIDFDAVYGQYLKPALESAGLRAHRADAEQRGGSIHADMFQDLLLAEFVLADLTIDNPNVWYEIGVRHALRAGGVVMTYAARDRLPFDLAGQRMQRYTLLNGKPDPDLLEGERDDLASAIKATRGTWRGHKASPVYAMLPNLQEPDWRTLKLGEVNEFWQALDTWQSRVEVAQLKQRPGDIVVLADETPNRVLELEALRKAGKALIDLKRPRYALSVLDRALVIDPKDLKCRQLRGIALGRDSRFEEAREALRDLAKESRDGETLGLLARSWKDEWTRLWTADPAFAADKLAAARNTAATLAQAAEAYAAAFQQNPADTYPGINALLFCTMWEHVTGRSDRFNVALIAGGVRWAVDCALARGKDYWLLVTRAEQNLIEGNRDPALNGYADAAALAVANVRPFDVDSSLQTLAFLRDLGFRSELVAEAIEVMRNAERQLIHRLGPQSAKPAEPTRVILFSGHMVDKPDRPTPRFPEAKASAAAAQIGAELDRFEVRPGDLGISQAASGGDLLFAHACLDRGMRLEIYLPQREPEFLAASVSFAAPVWQEWFDGLKDGPNVTFRVMPDEMGPTPEGVGTYDRCNRWMLYSALSCGLNRVSYLTLWDGRPGDGPGGTDNMVDIVRGLTGRKPVNIDPAKLGSSSENHCQGTA